MIYPISADTAGKASDQIAKSSGFWYQIQKLHLLYGQINWINQIRSWILIGEPKYPFLN